MIATLLLLGLPVVSAADAPIVERGEINGAPYRIELPAAWAGDLVVLAHGYIPRGMEWSPEDDWDVRMRAPFLDRGWAVAESGYARQGWAVEEALVDLESLRRWFVDHHGTPRRTIIAGYSMGGHITIATLERHPDTYDGGLPLCGPLITAPVFFEREIVDMLLTFETLFGNVLPDAMKPILDVPTISADAIEGVFEADPELAAGYARAWNRPLESVPRILAFYQLIYRELVDRAGGEPFDTRDTVYSGFGDDANLNRRIRRVTADPRAAEYLRLYASPTGRLADPALALLTTADPVVPAWTVASYDELAESVGSGNLFALRFVDANGHCTFSPDQLGAAINALVTWIDGGDPPPPGELAVPVDNPFAILFADPLVDLLRAATGSWRLTTVDGEPAPAVTTNIPTLNIADDGTISGVAGVNRVRASFTAIDGRLGLTPIAGTKMAGPPEAMALERAVLDRLQSLTDVTVDGDILTIHADDGGSLGLERLP
jgi:heat shock protein HslJ/pimeloyl-ACP methyl ester carboxylesterase